ncbi:hypothetical protein ABZ912_14470 [Nonomuraea angiospora]|uniref:hypothetical protein n=1 Tax=Nonomuraea angiospora TaxID=46172 RepID=UPI0033C074DC
MKRIETTDFTCGDCKQTGKIATSTLRADKPVEIKHAATAGGCGGKTVIRPTK